MFREDKNEQELYQAIATVATILLKMGEVVLNGHCSLILLLYAQ